MDGIVDVPLLYCLPDLNPRLQRWVVLVTAPLVQTRLQRKLFRRVLVALCAGVDFIQYRKICTQTLKSKMPCRLC